MKLMTKAILKQIPPLYAQENVEDPIVYVKFFTPDAQWTWFATEYRPEEHLFFGLTVSPMEPDGELGYFSLDELETVRGPLGLPIERDTSFRPKPLSLTRKHPF